MNNLEAMLKGHLNQATKLNFLTNKRANLLTDRQQNMELHKNGFITDDEFREKLATINKDLKKLDEDEAKSLGDMEGEQDAPDSEGISWDESD
jgi:hypothetical protein